MTFHSSFHILNDIDTLGYIIRTFAQGNTYFLQKRGGTAVSPSFQQTDQPPISFERLRDQIYEARVLAEEEICRLKAGIIEVECCN